MINKMPLKTFYAYYQCITMLDAEKTMVALNVQSYPWMKVPEQRSFFNQIKMMMKKYIDRTGGRLATMGDVMKAFGKQPLDGNHG